MKIVLNNQKEKNKRNKSIYIYWTNFLQFKHSKIWLNPQKKGGEVWGGTIDSNVATPGIIFRGFI